MEKYSEYKDSGVKWLGEIPKHWKMQRWRFLMKENTTKNANCKERLQLQFRYGDIVRKTNQSEESDVLDTISKYTVVNPDDIMINGLNLNYDFVSQRVAQVQEKGVITSAYISLRPTELANSRYFTYFLKSMDAKKMFHGMGTGIRLTLSYNELKNQFIPCPSSEEQSAIASFLDTATAKIDAAIAQQQKMIDLLNERKQIIINNAVTKGLNPNVKMKDSGVEWIGEVPEHWQLLPYRYLFYNLDKLRMPITADQRSRNNPQYDYYGASGVIDKIDYYNVDDKVLLIGEDGANLLLRNLPLIYKAEGKFWVNNHAHILKPIRDDYDFLAYVMEAADYTLYITGSAQPKLSQSNLNCVKLPIPPISEQKQIVDYLSKRTSKIDEAINESNKMISLLQERKQIIINDMVTGKVKICN